MAPAVPQFQYQYPQGYPSGVRNFYNFTMQITYSKQESVQQMCSNVIVKGSRYAPVPCCRPAGRKEAGVCVRLHQLFPLIASAKHHSSLIEDCLTCINIYTVLKVDTNDWSTFHLYFEDLSLYSNTQLFLTNIFVG